MNVLSLFLVQVLHNFSMNLEEDYSFISSTKELEKYKELANELISKGIFDPDADAEEDFHPILLDREDWDEEFDFGDSNIVIELGAFYEDLIKQESDKIVFNIAWAMLHSASSLKTWRVLVDSYVFIDKGNELVTQYEALNRGWYYKNYLLSLDGIEEFINSLGMLSVKRQLFTLNNWQYRKDFWFNEIPDFKFAQALPNHLQWAWVNDASSWVDYIDYAEYSESRNNEFFYLFSPYKDFKKHLRGGKLKSIDFRNIINSIYNKKIDFDSTFIVRCIVNNWNINVIFQGWNKFNVFKHTELTEFEVFLAQTGVDIFNIEPVLEMESKYHSNSKRVLRGKRCLREITKDTSLRSHLDFRVIKDDVASYEAIIDNFKDSVKSLKIEPFKVGSYTFRELTAREMLVCGEELHSNCCQRLDDAGETAMEFSIINENATVWALVDNKGLVVFQSLMWIDSRKGYIVFDSIESRRDYASQKERVREVFSTLLDRGYKIAIGNSGYGWSPELRKDFKGKSIGEVYPIDLDLWDLRFSGSWEADYSTVTTRERGVYLDTDYAWEVQV